MHKGLVSIIIPCYNQAQFLQETLDSVLKQTYHQWECIIVNDGSPDNTEEVVKVYCVRDARFRYIYKVNGGLSSARNAGLKEAKGEFIQFLDSDDLLEANKLECQVKEFQSHEEIDIVIGSSFYFEDGDFETFFSDINKNTKAHRSSFSGKGNSILKKVFSHNHFSVSAPLIKQNVISKVGYFDEALRSFEDWDYWIRCAFIGCSFKSLKKSTAITYIRIHKNSMSWNFEQMNRAYHQMMGKISKDEILLRDNGKKLYSYYLSCKKKMIMFQFIEHSRQNESDEVLSFMREWIMDNKLSIWFFERFSKVRMILNFYKYLLMMDNQIKRKML